VSRRTARSALGAWTPGATAPNLTIAVWQRALESLAKPLVVVSTAGGPAVAEGGQAHLGATATESSLPLMAHVPALLPGDLGAESFLKAHGVDAAYVVGEMANGIASEALVIAAARAGYLGVFGAAGLPLEHVSAAVDRLSGALAGLPWAVNLIHSPDDQALEAALVDLFLTKHVPLVSASAFLDLTVNVVKYRVAGIHRDADGRVRANRLMAKVSRVEVARKFLEPPPARLLTELVSAGVITAEQAALAATIPMADDVTAEADSGGHTDNRPLVLLLPALQALRDEVARTHGYLDRPRIGAAGGIATPHSVASAFAMGAAYVVTGSINQATREAGTSDLVRTLLAQATPTDVAMAPAADMFELGVKVQVLTRGTLFAVRATRLLELYRAHDALAALPPAVRDELEKKYFRCSLEEAWEGVRQFFTARDPAQLTRAAKEPKHQLALLFRAYLGQASKWANAGVADRTLDFQIWCGPAMGAFNEWVKGSLLESWESRSAVLLAKNLLVGAAVLTRIAALRSQGVEVPASLERFTPRGEAALDALVETAEVTAPPAIAPRPATKPSAEPIAIVGMGALFPQAENLQAFWRLVRTGRDAVSDIPPGYWSVADYFDADPQAPDKTYAKRGAFLSPTAFDPTEFGIPPSILEATDTTQLLGLVAARMAMEDAGYGTEATWDRSRASVILGVTGTTELVISLGARLGHPKWRRALEEAGVDAATAADVIERIGASYVGWQENSFPGLLGNVVAGRIANRLDFGGTNCIIDAACASSLGAVHLGVQELRSHHSDLVLTGGVDCLNDIFMHLCFSKTPALSASGEVRPFSDKADGTLLGEGLGMLVLKRLSDAERDGDRVYAVIRSVGSSSDGRAKSIYAPLPKGQARALRSAYAMAGVRPRDIGLLEAHGTGTRAGDAAEFEALTTVYREDSADAAWCTLGSVKSQVGHTKAAAGSAGLIKAALALHHKVLPPSLKVEAPNPAMKLTTSPFSITAQSRPWLARAEGPRLAAVSSFGFGGSNFHLVLQEHGHTRTAPAWDGSVELLALSAADQPALVAAVTAALQVPRAERSAFFAQTRAQFRSALPARLVSVVRDEDELEALLAPALAKLKTPGATAFSSDGVHVGFGKPDGRLAFLFPGQGSQHVDMLRDLATLFPEFLEATESSGIGAQLYPLATFEPDERARREAQLTRTEVAQPAIGTVSRAALQVLRRFGVEPELVAGHSYGELVALHAAGVFDVAGLRRASTLRGALMSGNGADRGTMLAVLAPLEQVEQLLAQEQLDVVLANRNTPTQGVLSGARAEIDRAEKACAARNLRTARLSVGAAFHSKLVAGAASEFRKGLAELPWKASRLPVIANTTALPYPLDAEAAKDLLGHQLAAPVKFNEVVERLYADGARTFVEVGPRQALTGMVRAILGSRSHVAVALDAGGRAGGLYDLGQVLARVAALGHGVQLASWQQPERPPRWVEKPLRVAKMLVPLTGANYRAPVKPLPPRAPRAPRASVDASPVRTAAPAPLAEGLRALQQMQEQTARLHQIFLEGQLAAHQNLQALLQRSPSSDSEREPIGQDHRAELRGGAPVGFARDELNSTKRDGATPIQAQPHAVDVVATMLAVVAEATGYPRETLELSMDLEADLGIDSIKRVEILSLLSRRIPDAPSVNPEKLSVLKTLAQVAAFIGSATPKNGVAAAVTVAQPSHQVVDVEATLLDAVSTLTGYPRETLQLGMDLEADLGIDSIKRVEILSAISRRIPGAPSVNPERLATLKTLQQILDFVGGSLGQAPTHAAPVAATISPSTDVQATLLEVVASLTGYPPQMLAPEMDLEADLGIDSIKRVEILSALSRRIPGSPSVNPEALSGLRTLAQIVAFVQGAPAATPPSRVEAPTVAPPEVDVGVEVERRAVVAVRAPQASPVALPSKPLAIVGRGSFAEALHARLPGSQLVDGALPSEVGGVVIVGSGSTWTAAGEQTLKQALQVARAAGPSLRAAGDGLFFTVSRRDGAFGLLDASSSEALDGGLAGLAKTAAHEWPEVRCRALDVSSQWTDAQAAQAVADELRQDGPVEVGLGPFGRLTLALQPHTPLAEPNRLVKGDLVIVTGGARGVTASCAAELAKATGVTLVLLGRSPPPVEEPDWLAAAADEPAIKRVLLAHAPIHDRPTPKVLGERSRAVLASREIRTSLQALTQAGVRAEYRSVDVRDGDAVQALVQGLRELGPIRGLVHGAGVLRDRRIEDKRDDDFDQVLDPKLAGLRSLLEATQTDALRVIALFTSVSGRFGRRGQADYAVANQALVAIAQREAATRPDCRVVAFDWGPWAGGMVTPSLRAEFEKEGVALIPLEAGAKLMVEEVCTAPGGPVELVVGAGFGPQPVAGWTLAQAHRLDASWPVLNDHRLAGRAVLPFAMTLEWFAQVAGPGAALEDVRIFKGVTLTEQTEDLGVWVSPAEATSRGLKRVLELRSSKDQVHVRANAVFDGQPRPDPLSLPTNLRPFVTSAKALYAQQLFHGSSLHTIEGVDGLSERGMTLRLTAPTDSSGVLPRSYDWAGSPVLLDGVFQALIVWCREQKGAPSLPSQLGALRQWARFPGGTVRAVVNVRDAQGASVTCDVDLLDGAGQVIARLEGYVCTVSPSLERAFGAPPASLAIATPSP
jgi:PfaD family protein